MAIWTGRTAAGHAVLPPPAKREKRSSFPVWWCMRLRGAYGIAAHTGNARASPWSGRLGLMNEGNRPVDVGYAYAFGWVAPT